MGQRLTLATHLTAKQIERRYRDSRDPVERSQWQIIWLLACGKVSEQVAEVVGYSLGSSRIVLFEGKPNRTILVGCGFRNR